MDDLGELAAHLRDGGDVPVKIKRCQDCARHFNAWEPRYLCDCGITLCGGCSLIHEFDLDHNGQLIREVAK